MTGLRSVFVVIYPDPRTKWGESRAYFLKPASAAQFQEHNGGSRVRIDATMQEIERARKAGRLEPGA